MNNKVMKNPSEGFFITLLFIFVTHLLVSYVSVKCTNVRSSLFFLFIVYFYSSFFSPYIIKDMHIPLPNPSQNATNNTEITTERFVKHFLYAKSINISYE